MEQKKTLWIVAAAGIFLLVVVGAALIIYSPSLHNTPVQQASFDPATGWVNASSVSGDSKSYGTPATPAPDAFAENSGDSSFDQLNKTDFDKNSGNSENNFYDGNLSNQAGKNQLSSNANGENQAGNASPTIKADNVNIYSQTTTFDLNALKTSNSQNLTAQNEKTYNQLESARANANAASSSASGAASADYSTADRNASYSEPGRANANAHSANFASENYYAPASAASVSKPKIASAAASTKSSSAASIASAKKSDSSSASAKSSKSSTAQKIADASKTPQSLFWVQVGAYSSKKNADSARAVLEENKIPVEVFTDSKYFKVRVGPYQTKSEASYWQKMISEIGKFADSKTLIINSAVQK